MMSQCVWFGQFCDVCGRVSVGCVGELVSGMMAVQYAGAIELSIVCVCAVCASGGGSSGGGGVCGGWRVLSVVW